MDALDYRQTGAVGDNIAVDSCGIVYVLSDEEYEAGGRDISLAVCEDEGATWTLKAFATSVPGYIGTLAAADLLPGASLAFSLFVLDRTPPGEQHGR
ncbi:MAG: hypothetical protein GY898_27160 [Proteobacteria bacterium]|nr:hypothetical protein [Pseudomonadota bacterium]